jgi:maleate isomerase
MGPRLSGAASLIVPDGRVDVIAYCCTSGTTAMGYDAVASSIQETRIDVPVVTPITAGLLALEKFGAKNVAVLTPYVDDVNRVLITYIEDNGPRVTALTSFLIADDNKMAGIPPDTIFAAALEADRPDADALFISCTAIRAVDVAEKIEQALGKPVICANQALFWQSLRVAGYTDPVSGYGELLSMAAE